MIITLRDVIDTDRPVLYKYQLDPEAMAMAAFPSRDHDAFMAHSAKIMADSSVVYQAILANGQVAGSIVSWEMEGNREVGYWLGRGFWGKGIATEALKRFLGVVETRPLFAHVAKHNLGSRRVLEKCGFRVIGEDTYVNIGNQEVEEILLRID